MKKPLIQKRKLFKRLGLIFGLNHTLINLKTPQKKRNIKKKEYLEILLKRQKIRFLYGLSRRQLSKIIKKHSNSTFKSLETRLDVLVFRIGYTHSIAYARQLIVHKHICVNNKIITYPGYICKKNDIIAPLITSNLFTSLNNNLERLQKKMNLVKYKSKILNIIKSSKIKCFPFYFNLISTDNLFPMLNDLPKKIIKM